MYKKDYYGDKQKDIRKSLKRKHLFTSALCKRINSQRKELRKKHKIREKETERQIDVISSPPSPARMRERESKELRKRKRIDVSGSSAVEEWK
jgi:hypothetical protein